MPIAYAKYKVIRDLRNASVYIVCARVCAKFLQSCETLCDPVDCSPPGSSVHGILQAIILEWVAMPFSRGSSWPQESNLHVLCLLHWQVSTLPLAPPGGTGKPADCSEFLWVKWQIIQKTLESLLGYIGRKYRPNTWMISYGMKWTQDRSVRSKECAEKSDPDVELWFKGKILM